MLGIPGRLRLPMVHYNRPTMSSSSTAHGTHSYYDWQVSTLMLAYDVSDPIPRSEDKRIADRQEAVAREIHDMAHVTIPQAYRDNPEMEFPPAVVTLLTKATLRRAAQIVGIA